MDRMQIVEDEVDTLEEVVSRDAVLGVGTLDGCRRVGWREAVDMLEWLRFEKDQVKVMMQVASDNAGHVQVEERMQRKPEKGRDFLRLLVGYWSRMSHRSTLG